MKGWAMATKRLFIRPDFDAHTLAQTMWLDGDWLTESEAKDLQRLLPPSMATEQRTVFMAAVNRALKDCELLQKSSPEGEQKVHLRAVAGCAGDLLQLMTARQNQPDTRATIRGVSAPFVVGLAGTKKLTTASEAAARENELMAHFWDTVRDIEAVFFYAAEQMKPDKQGRPKLRNERVLAGGLAKAHFQAVGEWPAMSDRSKNKKYWFMGFIDALPKRLGVAPGSDTVAKAIAELETRV